MLSLLLDSIVNLALGEPFFDEKTSQPLQPNLKPAGFTAPRHSR